MSIPKRPEKKKVDKRFDWTFQNLLHKKYNQAIEEFERFLPSEDELYQMILHNPCLKATAKAI